jgi:hypothetical protein
MHYKWIARREFGRQRKLAPLGPFHVGAVRSCPLLHDNRKKTTRPYANSHGIYRVGGIAALIADADRYVLATYFQENLKYVKPGQPIEVSLDLFPGQIFAGKVDSIWRGNGVGQYLPSDINQSF